MSAETVQKTVEKWILMQSMHLGYVKDSFAKGSIIEFDLETRTMRIEGKLFETTKDLDILKRQAQDNPETPWIVPFTPEAAVAAKSTSVPVQRPNPKQEDRKSMKVVQSDEDLMDVDIDITHTQIGKNKTAQKAAEKAEVKEKGMPIIRGDESVEDRVRRLQTSVPKMPIVKDDSLGNVAGKALNEGKVPAKRSSEEIAKIRRDNLKKARDAKKQKVAENGGEANGGEAKGDAADGVERTPVRSKERAAEVVS